MAIRFGLGLGSAGGGGGGLSVLPQNRLLGRGSTSGTGPPEAITLGNSVVLTATALDTIQDIRTSATPTFFGVVITSPGLVVFNTASAGGNPTLRGNGLRFEAVRFDNADFAAFSVKSLNMFGPAFTQISLLVPSAGILEVNNGTAGAYRTVNALGYQVSGVAGANFGPGLATSITVVNGIITAIS